MVKVRERQKGLARSGYCCRPCSDGRHRWCDTVDCNCGHHWGEDVHDASGREAVLDTHIVQSEHVSSPKCWCRPYRDFEDPFTGEQVWVHRVLVQ